MVLKQNKTYLILALAIVVGLLFHGASFFNTLNDTYDLYVHMFFADHYSNSWFEPWEDRWYTGFNMISYPPLVHQLIALLSFIGGLRFGAYLLAFGIILLYVTGAYRFSKLLTINEESAGYSALVAVFCPSVIEALHVFGQLPTVMGIGWLLHALPEIYLWVRVGKIRYFFNGITLIAVAVASHHVTPIFGMVFFVLPIMATAIMDRAAEANGSYKRISLLKFIKLSLKSLPRIIAFGISMIITAITVIFPYWMWSKNDPISQVPIPHGSRDSFIEVFSSGLVFFIIPWGFFLVFLPFLVYRFYSKRNLFIGLSFSILFILGTGGTTPIPKMMLGENAFSILTLERFTFWATILSIPFIGEFLWRFFEGTLYNRITLKINKIGFNILVVILITTVFFSSGFTMNLSFFRPLQPEAIELTPITNFLKSDKHYKWRYLTLGFGDQMALLSAKTSAKTIDGNYHSARRVPELTTRAIERLENSKYRGVEGIGTLQQFLTAPEIFHLKYIFSNDAFYDPILYFSGWHRVKRLSNGITVWERSDVSPLPSVLPKKEIPKYQKVMWGTIPLGVLFIAFICNVQLHWMNHVLGHASKRDQYLNPETLNDKLCRKILYAQGIWVVIIIVLTCLIIGNIYWLNLKQNSPEKVVKSWYDALDFKRFEEAHSFLSPNSNKSLDQFLLETSVSDGLLESYGKLNSIICEKFMISQKEAVVVSHLEWITSLEKVSKTVRHRTVKFGNKWYMVPEVFEYTIPTNQFFSNTGNNFYNQGRRSVTTEETFHKDVLDRPVVQVLEAKLVQHENRYAVIGTIQNIDDYPADISIKASLINEKGSILTTYYDKFHLKHKLLPKEKTPFRIDFEAIGWKNPELTNSTYDPAEFNEINLNQEPHTFHLEILSTVSTQDLFSGLSLQNIEIDSTNSISGNFFNHSHQTATITQMITAFYKNNKLMWVGSHFHPKSIFPSRFGAWQFQLPLLDNISIISNSGTVTVNGVLAQQITKKYRSKSKLEPIEPLISRDGYSVNICLNSFIANPSSF